MNQSSRRDLFGLATFPGAEAPGYFQMPLRGELCPRVRTRATTTPGLAVFRALMFSCKLARDETPPFRIRSSVVLPDPVRPDPGYIRVRLQRSTQACGRHRDRPVSR